jgi:hypothetical protein
MGWHHNGRRYAGRGQCYGCRNASRQDHQNITPLKLTSRQADRRSVSLRAQTQTQLLALATTQHRLCQRRQQSLTTCNFPPTTTTPTSLQILPPLSLRMDKRHMMSLCLLSTSLPTMTGSHCTILLPQPGMDKHRMVSLGLLFTSLPITMGNCHALLPPQLRIDKHQMASLEVCNTRLLLRIAIRHIILL